MPAAGTTCLYRPVPDGFDDLFIGLGWGGIVEATNAGWKTVVKWLDIRNAERITANMMTLQEARAYKVRQEGRVQHPKHSVEARPKSAAARYVIGRTRRPIRWPNPAPRFWDFGLIPGVSAVAKEKAKVPRISPLKAASMIEAQAAQLPPAERAGMLKAAELLRAQVGGQG